MFGNLYCAQCGIKLTDKLICELCFCKRCHEEKENGEFFDELCINCSAKQDSENSTIDSNALETELSTKQQ